MIAQSLSVNPEIVSTINQEPLGLVAAEYVFSDTPAPVNPAPVPYDNLLYIVLIRLMTSPPFYGALCVIYRKRKGPLKRALIIVLCVELLNA
ncbi:hypothetical protein BIY26_09410 [Brenneria goodwinii]|uniref:Uncharacterized protein n=1 Tax=Brenneria goodwinii TaxID=1109412 RepID=A0AAE8ES22_9GAMM|nr:hypothetical protein AWC36_05030 [Brenneria goodwinii]RLM25226.1 hypothetical protein BIY26_09410 [Brenneria goodwinii]